MKKFDIRKDTPESFRRLWLKEQFERLRRNDKLKHLSDSELSKFLLKKYDERRLVNGRFYNNTDNKNELMTQEDFINMYLRRPYILSGYACFYENQNNSQNISSLALENLGDLRKFNKKKMEAAVHGSSDYIYYRILQLTFKVLMNSYYGIKI